MLLNPHPKSFWDTSCVCVWPSLWTSGKEVPFYHPSISRIKSISPETSSLRNAYIWIAKCLHQMAHQVHFYTLLPFSRAKYKKKMKKRRILLKKNRYIHTDTSSHVSCPSISTRSVRAEKLFSNSPPDSKLPTASRWRRLVPRR